MRKKEDEHFRLNKQSTRSRSIVPVASYTYMQAINVLARSKRELAPVPTLGTGTDPGRPGCCIFGAGRARATTEQNCAYSTAEKSPKLISSGRPRDHGPASFHRVPRLGLRR